MIAATRKHLFGNDKLIDHSIITQFKIWYDYKYVPLKKNPLVNINFEPTYLNFVLDLDYVHFCEFNFAFNL